MFKIGFLYARASLAVLFVLSFHCILNVEGKPAGGFFLDDVPDLSTNLNMGKIADVIQGKRDLNINLSKNGLEVNAGLSEEQKLIIGVVAAGAALLLVICMCVCCCRICCGNRDQQTNIIYQQLTPRPAHNSHSVPITHISSVSAGWNVDCPPPPYTSITAPTQKTQFQVQKF